MNLLTQSSRSIWNKVSIKLACAIIGSLLLQIMHGLPRCFICFVDFGDDTISDQEFETFWPLGKLYHNCYTLGLQFFYSCQYISHEHEYIFYFFIVQLWKLTEASRSLKVIVSGDWNGCHIEVRSNCQISIGWMLLTLAFSIHIWSAQNHACRAQRQRIKIHWIVSVILHLSAWFFVFEVASFTSTCL